MFLEISFRVMDGLETLAVYGDKFYAPSGSHVRPDSTSLYQNIKFLDYNDAQEMYGVQTSEYHWYLVLGLRKGITVPSRVFRQKNRNKGYVFPVELLSMTIDGKPSDKGLNLLLSKAEVQSATVYPRSGRITMKANILTVAEKENYVLRSAYYRKSFEDALAKNDLVYVIPRETWDEDERFTLPLAQYLGRALFKIMSNTNVTTNRTLTKVTLDTFNECVSKGTLIDNEDQSLIDTASPEEKLRMERMMREIMQAEAELKGLTIEEVEQQAADRGFLVE